MKTDDRKLINCGNDFYPHLFDTLCKELDEGGGVEVYIDCIGHSMNNRLQEVYREKLIEKYGNRLLYTHSDGAHSYSYSYKLADKE